MNDAEGINETQTTARGLFHLAHSYWRSAAALKRRAVAATHHGDVVWFLYCHAVELYLKAFLRGEGVSVKDLHRKFGHSFPKLANAAEQSGMRFDDEDREVIARQSG